MTSWWTAAVTAARDAARLMRAICGLPAHSPAAARRCGAQARSAWQGIPAW
ncbi:hypothetical protein [Actinoplanes sp. RD1]|uniref:hypothetical protein n=1 Tax=Actinoplanes sp. RD1 TaxID=3064538 RepID=UPI002741D3A7|nr:hypothetical protein [Actinoplanes sp. RD1]